MKNYQELEDLLKQESKIIDALKFAENIQYVESYDDSYIGITTSRNLRKIVEMVGDDKINQIVDSLKESISAVLYKKREILQKELAQFEIIKSAN